MRSSRHGHIRRAGLCCSEAIARGLIPRRRVRVAVHERPRFVRTPHHVNLAFRPSPCPIASAFWHNSPRLGPYVDLGSASFEMTLSVK